MMSQFVTLSSSANAGSLPACPQAIPISREVLCALTARLARHFDYNRSEWDACIAMLSSYPEDLVCAAYYRVMHHNALSCPELLHEMVSFMSPELQFRLLRHRLIAQSREKSA